MNPNDFLYQILREVPGLAVNLIIVVAFLKNLGRRDELARTVSEECHDVQRETASMMKENIDTLRKHTDSIKDLARVVERCRLHQNP